MKHLKIFEKFNELPDFEFAIDIRNSSEDDIKKANKEFEKYTDYVKINNNIKKSALHSYLIQEQPSWAWHIKIENYFDKKLIVYNGITTPNWGADVEWMEYIITLKEFLSVGLAGVKDYIELKKTTDKYNI